VPKQAQVHDSGDTARPAARPAQQPTPPRANDTQVAGDHYKQFKHETWDVILDWGLGYLDGNAVKYLSRWRHKNGLEDLKKARHYIDKLIETEMEKRDGTDSKPT
jgi:hypothetical protein